MNQNNKEDKVIKKLFEAWAKSADEAAKENGLDDPANQQRILDMVKLYKQIISYKTDSCLDSDLARDYSNGDSEVLKQFGEHVAKCADYCQKLVQFYNKKL